MLYEAQVQSPSRFTRHWRYASIARARIAGILQIHCFGKGSSRKNWTIDPSGTFHNGPSFANYQELRNHILARESDFARGFTEHLIEYALGRPFSIIDDELAKDMMNKASLKNYSISEFIHTLVQSETFRKK